MSEKYAGLTALQENVVKTKEHVESVRAVLDAKKANVFAYSTIPQNPTEGMIIMWVGADTQNMSKGGWYQYTEVTPSTDPKTYFWDEITASIDIDNVLNPSSNNPVSNSGLTDVIQALQGNVVLMYASESNLLDEIDYASGQIVTLNTIAYCVSEHTWYKVTAIDSSTLAVTWTAYNPHLSGTYNANDFSVDASTDEVSLLPSRRIFKGSHTAWNNLTLAQKAEYAFVAFDDDTTAGQGDSRKQDKELSSPVTIGGVQYVTVETALAALSQASASAFMHTEGV